MTAGLGSEYRYFGKVVLVPFRYFSIDIYRNIDIFDNTTPFFHFVSLKLTGHEPFTNHGHEQKHSFVLWVYRASFGSFP